MSAVNQGALHESSLGPSSTGTAKRPSRFRLRSHHRTTVFSPVQSSRKMRAPKASVPRKPVSRSPFNSLSSAGFSSFRSCSPKASISTKLIARS